MVGSAGDRRAERRVAKVYGVDHLARSTQAVVDELDRSDVAIAVVVEGAPRAKLSRKVVVRGVFDADTLKRRLGGGGKQAAMDDLVADAIRDYRIKYRRNVLRLPGERARLRGAGGPPIGTSRLFSLSPTGIQLPSPTGIQLPSPTTGKAATGPPKCQDTPHPDWSRYRCNGADNHLFWCEDGADGRRCEATASTGGSCPGVLERFD